ncbi:hypothetical protein K2X40_03035 [Candidatus Babeliales bacterium]|nr:hypothetical protein [Candidatus Babeliales bacterium]
MKNIKLSLVSVMLTLTFFATLVGIQKTESEVFGDLFATQHSYADRNLETMATLLDNAFVHAFEHQCECHAVTLNSAYPFITTLSDQEGVPFDRPIKPAFYNNLCTLYTYLEQKNPALISLLSNLDMSTPESLSLEYGGHGAGLAVEKYSILLDMLFAQELPQERFAYSLAAANRIFELCFNPETFNACYHLHLDAINYSIARFLYVAMWKHFALESWESWHLDCLNQLKQAAQENKKIVYIGGGYDIYQLLRSGIYSFSIIDSFTSPHNKTYPANATWLLESEEVGNGIGDTLTFEWDNEIIILERKSFNITNTFSLQQSQTNILEIPASITTWTVKNAAQKELGLIKFIRRPLCSSDFDYKKNTLILMSFSDFFHTVIPDFLGGYGVDVKSLAPEFFIMIKQLRAPATKDMMLNIRVATLLNLSDLQFISLGNSGN